MKLTDLSKPQWDAALAAAQSLMRGNVHNPDDRADFRTAKARLVELLPADVSASKIIEQAAHWNALNTVAAAVAGLPAVERVAA